MVRGSLCWWRDKQIQGRSSLAQCRIHMVVAQTVLPFKRILILSGPAGSAKTATLRVLSREMDIDVVEYKTSEGDSGKYSEVPGNEIFGI